MQEPAGLLFVKLATFVSVEVLPDLIDGFANDALSFCLGRDAVREGLVLEEDGVVDEDLDVVGKHFPRNRVFVHEGLAVDHDHLLVVRGLLSFGGQLKLWLGDLVRNVDADLAPANVRRVSLVGLDAAATTSIGHDARDAQSALPGRIRNPGDVDQAVVDGGKRIHNHTAITELAVAHLHQGRVDASLTEGFVVDGQLVVVGHKATAEGLQVSG